VIPVLRQAWRYLWRRPLQSLFFVLGVAIGVAMIVAIDLANGSAQRAFDLGTETVTGRATHQITGGPGGLDELLYTRLRTDLGIRVSAPVVEAYVAAPALDNQPMRLLGVDAFAESPFRGWLGMGDQSQAPAAAYLADLMSQPDTILLSQDLASRYGMQTGNTLTVDYGGNPHALTIVGLLATEDDLSRRALDGMILADIATAQEVLGKVGRLDRIDLILPEGDARETMLAEIRGILPPDARLDSAAARSGTVSEMTDAFRLNLTALSLLALVVGMFLIYNTVTFGVVQRRPVLGSLRALGMTRGQIFATILVEAGILGLIGTLLGLGLGVFLGRGAVQLVTQTVNDLFFVVTVRDVALPTATLVKGFVIGIAAALLGAAVPAWEATSVPPAGALRRSNVEERVRKVLPWVSGAGVLLLLLGGVLLIPDWTLWMAFAGLATVVLGSAMLTPLALLGLMALAQRLLRRAGVIERMAPRTVTRSLSRTAVAVAALMVAVSVIIGVGVMIGSFRQTVVRWLDQVLQADIFVSPPSLQSNQLVNELDASVARIVAGFPGISRSATARHVDVTAEIPGGVLANPIIVPLQVSALSNDLAGADRQYRASIGNTVETWQAVQAGGVLINEPMANRYDLRVGDSLSVQTDQGMHNFPVVGVTVDFDVNPVATMDDAVYRQWWNDDAISNIGLFVEPGTDVDAKVNELRVALAGKNGTLVTSNRGTREQALRVFDRTFAITVALQLLATLVAFIGILSTLMSLQLERQREIGILRATGMTRRQLWRLSLFETGLIGSSAGLLALPVGMVLALILIYIINLRSFGWTLELNPTPRTFLQAFVIALGAALLAGIYPAWKMGQIQPATAVRSE
jgi:putative ABC transport system permease protein